MAPLRKTRTNGTRRSVLPAAPRPLLDALEPRVMLSSDSSDMVFHNPLVADNGLTVLAGEPGQSIVFESGLTVHGDLVLDGAGTVIFEGSVHVTGGVSIIAGGKISFAGQFNVGQGATLTAGEIDFLGGAGSVQGAGLPSVLMMKTPSSGAGIRVGDGAIDGPGLDLTVADLAAIATGFQSIVIGDPSTRTDVTIGTAAFGSNVSVYGKDITVVGALQEAPGKSVLLWGRSVTVEGMIADSGGTVTVISSDQTTIASSGAIDVSGLADSSGGEITLWSSVAMTVAGSLAARGGPAGGDGGSIEVCSMGTMSLAGGIDTGALTGRSGRLLIDPKNVIIGAVDDGDSQADLGQFDNASADSVNLSAAVLEGWNTSVTIQANTDITVNSAISMGAGNSLTLQAGRSVLINADIVTTGQALTIIANDPGAVSDDRDAGPACITMAAGTTLSAGAGSISLTIDTGAAGTVGDMSVDGITTTGTINLQSAGPILEAGLGVLTANEANFVTTAASAAIGTSDKPIQTNISNLSANTYDGGIYINNDGALSITSVTAHQVELNNGVPTSNTPYANASGLIVLNSQGMTGTWNIRITAGGPIFLGTVTAPNTATIATTNGCIYEGLAPGSNNVIAQTVNLQATGNIGQGPNPVTTTNQTVTASSSGGSVYLTQVQGTTISNVSADEDVVITAASGNLFVEAITASGTVTLTTGSGAILNGGSIAAGAAALSATTAIGSSGGPLNVAAARLTASVSGAVAPIYINDAVAPSSLAVTTNKGLVAVGYSGGSLGFVPATGVLSAPAAAGIDITFNNTGGNLIVDTIDAGAGSVNLTAAGAITSGASDTVVLTGGAVTLTAGTNIGAEDAPLQLAVDSLTASASAGSIDIVALSAITVTATAKGASSNINISNALGDMTLGAISAPGEVILATSESLLDGTGGVVTDITGASATLVARGAIGSVSGPLTLAVANVSAIAGDGGVFLSADGDLLVKTAATTGGNLAVSVIGDLVFQQVVAEGSAVIMTATGAITEDSGPDSGITAASASLDAASIGTISTPIDMTVTTLVRADAANGGIYIANTGDLAVSEASVAGADNDIAITSTIGILLGQIFAPGNDVTLSAGTGAITNGGAGGVANVTAHDLRMAAPGGIGTPLNPLELSVDQLNAFGGSVGVYTSNAAPLLLAAASLAGQGSATLIYTAPSIAVQGNGGQVVTLGMSGSLILRSTTGNVVFLDLRDTIRAQGAGTITIQAGTTPGSGAVAIVGNLVTADQDITVTADGNAVLGGTLDAGSGTVTVTSTSGQIVGNPGLETLIAGGSVILTARTPSPLRAQTVTLAAMNASASAANEASSGQVAAAAANAAASRAKAAMNQAAQVLATAKAATASAQTAYATAIAKSDKLGRDAIALKLVSTAVLDALTVAMDIPSFMGATTGLKDALRVAQRVAAAAEAVANAAVAAADAATADAKTALDRATAMQELDQDILNSATTAYNQLNGSAALATAAAIAALGGKSAAAVAAQWALAAQDQDGAIGASDSPLAVNADEISARAATGGIFLFGMGDYSLNNLTACSGGLISIQATGSITLAGAITNSTGVVSLEAGNQILDGGGSVTALQFAARAGEYIGTSASPIKTAVRSIAADGAAGGVFVANTGPLTLSDVTYTSSTRPQTVTGITASGDVSVTTSGSLTLNASVSASGQVTIVSTAGAIQCGTQGAASIIGDGVALAAALSIGTSLNPVVFAADNIQAAGGTGGVFLTATAGSVTIGGTAPVANGIAAIRGDIVMIAQGPLTIDAPVTNSGGGKIHLITTGADGNEDLTVNSNVTTYGNGNLAITSAGNILTSPASNLTAGGALTLLVDDLAAGSSILLAGPIVADLLAVTGGNYADTLTIDDATVGSTNINMGGGDDVVTIAPGCTMGDGEINFGDGDDTLNLSSPVDRVNGGAGYDSIVYGDVDDVTVNLAAGTATDVAEFRNIESFQANNPPAADNTLIGANAANVWHITGAGAGNIGGPGVFDFAGFGNLTGGSCNDAFLFSPGVSPAGSLYGGGGVDTIDYGGVPFVDLTAQFGSMTMPPHVISGDGTKIHVPLIVKNQGNLPVPAGQRIDIAIYARTTDDQGDNVDTLITTMSRQRVGSLRVGASAHFGARVTLPAGLATGTYSLVAVADSFHTLTEPNLFNNTAVSSGTLSVTRGFVGLTSVLGTLWTLPSAIVSGHAMRGFTSVVVNNMGNLAMPAGQRINIELIAHDTATNADISLMTLSNQSVGRLTPGRSAAFRLCVNRPTGLPAGTYQIEAIVTPVGDLVESRTDNNTATLTGTGTSKTITSTQV